MKKLMVLFAIFSLLLVSKALNASDIQSLKESAIKGDKNAITAICNLTDAGPSPDQKYNNWISWNNERRKEYIDALIDLSKTGMDETFEKIESMYKNRTVYFKKISDGDEIMSYWKKTLAKNMEENNNLFFKILDSKVIYPIVVTDWKTNIKKILIVNCNEKKSLGSAKFLMKFYFEYPDEPNKPGNDTKEILYAVKNAADERYINEILENTKKTNNANYDFMWRILKPEEAALYDKASEEEKNRKLVEEQKRKEMEKEAYNKLHNKSLNHNYYPIVEGAQWIYNIGGNQTVIKIEKLKIEEGVITADVTINDVIDDTKKEPSYLVYKMRLDKLSRLDENGMEKVLLYFPLKPQTVKKDTYQTFKVGKLLTVSVPAGKFSQCIEVEKRFSDGGWVRQWYAPDVGLIKFVSDNNRNGELMNYNLPQQ